MPRDIRRWAAPERRKRRKTFLSPPIITLTTDIGLTHTDVGVVKGVILGITPQARLVDLTHNIGPQNVLEASARLEYAAPFVPPGTIHSVLVDPGVGSDRAAIIVRTESCLFVAPDNGIPTLNLRALPPIEAARLARAAEPYLRNPVSSAVHGRDFFAPVATHLAQGLQPARFGEQCSPRGADCARPASARVRRGRRFCHPSRA